VLTSSPSWSKTNCASKSGHQAAKKSFKPEARDALFQEPARGGNRQIYCKINDNWQSGVAIA
jgi:hypothetical protein